MTATSQFGRVLRVSWRDVGGSTAILRRLLHGPVLVDVLGKWTLARPGDYLLIEHGIPTGVYSTDQAEEKFVLLVKTADDYPEEHQG